MLLSMRKRWKGGTVWKRRAKGVGRSSNVKNIREVAGSKFVDGFDCVQKDFE